jgi:hypothetical protein
MNIAARALGGKVLSPNPKPNLIDLPLIDRLEENERARFTEKTGIL